MTKYRYRECSIIRSSNWTKNGRSLYVVEGRYEKNAGTRPFLTTIRECKNWIDNRDMDAEMRAPQLAGIRAAGSACATLRGQPDARRVVLARLWRERCALLREREECREEGAARDLAAFASITAQA